jgi:hypothetical protein
MHCTLFLPSRGFKHWQILLAMYSAHGLASRVSRPSHLLGITHPILICGLDLALQVAVVGHAQVAVAEGGDLQEGRNL